MAGIGFAPKPAEESRTHYRPAFGWVELPERHRRRPPPLPEWREWHPATLQWWKGLWTTPQAAAWQRNGATLAPAALVFDALVRGDGAVAALSAELRQHYDRHGLNPKALLSLRWRIDVGTGGGEPPARSGTTLSPARRRRLARSLEVVEASE